MRIERVYTDGLAQVAYLVGDEETGAAAVIDPRRDVDIYLDLARSLGLRIVATLETHVHADFVSGARELAEQTGAPVYSSRLGEQEFPHTPLEDGDEVPVGSLRLKALWTPGHTPEHLCYLLYDRVSGDRPLALFSGDMLFAGEVGRPDLLGEEVTDVLVGQLYESIFDRLTALPDDLIVYPGHGAGSSCGRSIGSAPSTTIGQEKRFNYAFRPRTLDAFRATILESMPPAPTYYPMLKRINRIGPRLLHELPPARPLTPAEVARHSAEGAVLIDGRSAEGFAGAHIPGSVSLGLGGDFIAWAGWLAPYDRDIILVLDTDDQFELARTQLRRIGLDRVLGYLEGGIGAWERAGYDLVSFEAISVHELKARLERGNVLTVLDVRSQSEWESGHIPGALHRYAGLLAQGRNGIPEDSPVAVICGSGYRSSFVASLLEATGRSDVANVLGGMEAWTAVGYPTDR